MAWRTDVRQSAFDLRAQGLTLREVATTLATRFPDSETPDYSTLSRWLTDPDAQGLVQQAATRIRATVAQQTHEVIGGTYDALREAVEQRDFRAADAYSRAVVNLTRGFIQERVEVTARVETEQADELASILARHGVKVLETQRDAASENG